MAHANKLYVEQPLVEMRAAFDKDGLYGLSKRIHNLEVNFAENVYESRIWDQPDYHGYAEQLLAQVTPEMLHSILSNTLPADVISNRVTLEPWAKISLSPQHANSIDPGIYANFLAAQDGSAMDLKDFELFLDALDAALLGNRMANGQDICRDVNNYYNQQHRTVRNVVLLDATLRTNTLDKSRDTFIRLNRERLKDAQGQGATHITIPGECGWSKNVNARCQQHKKLESSPAIFRVANCVLHVLFPRKNFRMHHFCLMKAFRAEHAAVGESIGHHLVLSYAKYGGFNFAQAGFSVLGAMDMTFMEWQLACTSSVRVLNYIQARLDQEDAKLHVRLKRARLIEKIALKQESVDRLNSEVDEAKTNSEKGAALARVEQEVLSEKFLLLYEIESKISKKMDKSVVAFNNYARVLGIMTESGNVSSDGSTGDGQSE